MKSVLLIIVLIVLSTLISSCSIIATKKPKTVSLDMDINFDEISLEEEQSENNQKTTKVIPQKQKVQNKTITKAKEKSMTPKTGDVSRAPASINNKKTTGNIVYTPLWISIPISECLEIVKNPHYKNGACIKRAP